MNKSYKIFSNCEKNVFFQITFQFPNKSFSICFWRDYISAKNVSILGKKFHIDESLRGKQYTEKGY